MISWENCSVEQIRCRLNCFYKVILNKDFCAEIFAYDELLFNPIWFWTQMCILLFDDELVGLVFKIFKKFGATQQLCVLKLVLRWELEMWFLYKRDKTLLVSSIWTLRKFSLLWNCIDSQLNSIRSSITFNMSECKIIEEDSQAFSLLNRI